MGQSQEMEVGQAHMDTTNLFSASDQKGRQCVHKIPPDLGVETSPFLSAEDALHWASFG